MTELYRHFNAAGDLLYVGIARSTVARLKGHKRTDWAGEIATITVERFCTRAAAMQAERAAILAEKPRHNRQIPGKARSGPQPRHDARWGELARADHPSVYEFSVYQAHQAFAALTPEQQAAMARGDWSFRG